MTLTCSAFRATSVPDGFRLEIDTPTESDALDPNGTRLFYVRDLVPILKKTPRTIYKMGKRKRDPLPFSRGRVGRPFCIESALWHWLQGPKGRGLV